MEANNIAVSCLELLKALDLAAILVMGIFSQDNHKLLLFLTPMAFPKIVLNALEKLHAAVANSAHIPSRNFLRCTSLWAPVYDYNFRQGG